MAPLPQALTSLITAISEHPFASLIAAFSIIFFRRTYTDHQDWLALGPGGLPHSAFGYVLVRILGLWASSDTKSTQCYDQLQRRSPRKTPIQRDYLKSEDFPIREGQAPVVSKWIGPVRQTSSHASQEHIRAIDDMLTSLSAAHGNLSSSSGTAVTKAPSAQEGGYSPALFVHSANSKGGKREVYHYHGSDGSAHATLSLADAKLVLDRGWGERHVLSGRSPDGKIPLTYVMIYAPRNERELEMHRAVAEAAMKWALDEVEKRGDWECSVL